MARPYRYETACKALATALADLRCLSGDEMNPSGAPWQDIAGTSPTCWTRPAGGTWSMDPWCSPR